MVLFLSFEWKNRLKNKVKYLQFNQSQKPLRKSTKMVDIARDVDHTPALNLQTASTSIGVKTESKT